MNIYFKYFSFATSLCEFVKTYQLADNVIGIASEGNKFVLFYQADSEIIDS